MARLQLPWKRNFYFECPDCGDVDLRVEGVRLLVCLEDNFHSLIYTCPKCNIQRSSDAAPGVTRVSKCGIVAESWSVHDMPWPIIGQPQKNYKPRVTTRSKLPFDDTDVQHLIHDMDTLDWFSLWLRPRRS